MHLLTWTPPPFGPPPPAATAAAARVKAAEVLARLAASGSRNEAAVVARFGALLPALTDMLAPDPASVTPSPPSASAAAAAAATPAAAAAADAIA